MARNADLLRPLFDFVLPTEPIVQLLLDKSAFRSWAEARGFPVPRTLIVASPAELTDALEQVTYPVIFKPFTRTARWQEASRYKVYRLESADDLARLPAPLFELAPRYVVQEWIPGLDDDVHFCLVYPDRSGRERGHLVGRKLLQWPVGTGNTAVCTIADDDRESCSP